MAPIKHNIIQLIDMSLSKTPPDVLQNPSIKLILAVPAYEELCQMKRVDFIDQYKDLKILVFGVKEYRPPAPYMAIASKEQFEHMVRIPTKEPYKIELAYDPYGAEWRAQIKALPIKTVLDLFQAVAHDKMDMQKQIIVLEDKVREREQSAIDMGAKTIAISRNYIDIMRRMSEELMKVGYSTETSREMADLIVMIDSLGPPPKITVTKERPTSTGIKDKYGFEIKDRHIVKSGQGAVFVVDYIEKTGQWVIIQANKSDCPEHQGEPFALEAYMSPNLEIIGDIDKNPELLKD